MSWRLIAYTRALNSFFQPGEVDGLSQVIVEAGLEGSFDVGVHSEAGQRDGGQFFAQIFADGADQVDACAVGKADVADEDVELVALQGLQGVGDGMGGGDGMLVDGQQPGEHARGIDMILDQQDAIAGIGGLPGRFQRRGRGGHHLERLLYARRGNDKAGASAQAVRPSKKRRKQKHS